MQTQRFRIGDTVTCRAFTDCFGDLVPARAGYVVEDVRRVDTETIAPYYRVKAHDPSDPFRWVEAAERFFDAS